MSRSQVLIPVSAETAAQLESLAREENRPVEEIAARVLEEHVRARQFPGIHFLPTARGGRKACLPGGPAVRTVVQAARLFQMDPVRTAAHLEIPIERARLALDYYAAYPEEIDSYLDRLSRFDEDPARFCPGIETIPAVV